MPMPADSFAFIIFGATGNLAQLKLIPALYDLADAGLLPPSMHIIGVGRKDMDDDGFRTYTNDVLHQPNRHHMHTIRPEVSDQLMRRMHYMSGDISRPEIYDQLLNFLGGKNACNNRMFYLATFPELYSKIFMHLEKSGLNTEVCGWVRVIVEKPIGTDLSSSKSLNKLLASYYVEDQIYRLDHYLGRETLQNILTFRFGNGVFEPMINREHIDHIQVTATEDFGIGMRGGYFDTVGSLKDVGQNHLLQMLALTTMEHPKTFTNSEVTASRINLLKQLVPESDRIVFGQYEGYHQEPNIDSSTNADTFFALRTHIKSDRFRGVPIYMRAGKKLNRTVTEVSFVFKVAGKRLFAHVPGGLEPNVLIYRIQPAEGIVLRFMTKVPGPEIKLEHDYMQFCYKNTSTMLPDPYLRLLVDVLRGDQTFFVDAPEVEAQWKFTDPLTAMRKKPVMYKPGSWGPTEADDLIRADGREWLEPSVAFCRI